MTSKRTAIFFLILFLGASCLWQGLNYFIAGKQYHNTQLRNYAVVGQIVFALAVIVYGFWYRKTSAAKIP